MGKGCNILLESDGAYRFLADARVGREDAGWYTPSPYVFEKIRGKGGRAFFIEGLISHEEMDRIGSYCRECARKIGALLDDRYTDWPYDIRVGYALLLSVRKTLFILLYRFYLLQCFIHATEREGKRGLIVGSDALSPTGGFDIKIGRFDTVYAALARRMDLPGSIEVMDQPGEEGKEKIRQLQSLGRSLDERLRMVRNLNVNILFFKIWKRLLRSRDIRNPLGESALSLLFYKSSDLTDQILFPLALKGGRVHNFELDLKGDDFPLEGLTGIPAPSLSRILHDFPFPGLREGFDVPKALGILSEIMADRLNSALEFGWRWAKGLEVSGEEYFSRNVLNGTNGKAPMVLLTSALTTPADRALLLFLRKKKVPVFAAEHGVTHGLTEWSRDYLGNGSDIGVLASDMALFYNEASREIHEREAGFSRGFVVGAPVINQKVRFRALEKMLTRRLIGVPRDRRLVVYVANLYSNNSLENPGLCKDDYYHEVKKRVVYEVLGKIEDPCLLKLYPTHRYVDDDPFLELMKLPENVKVIQYFEYRYLRAVGDVIICDSPQSTLGWVWSAGVPLIFLDLPFTPLLPEVARDFEEAIFLIDCSDSLWTEKVRELLLLPQRELLRIWKEKAPRRMEVGKKRILGPPGSSGNRGAGIVIEEIRRWHERVNAGA